MNKLLYKNFSYLLSLQVFNLLLPLITYPYLINVLGTDIYGEFIYYQGVIAFLCIFVLYGFDLTGTKLISENREDSLKLSEIFSNIIYVRILNCCLIIPCYLYFCYVNESYYLILFLGMFLDKIFFPQWFFQGLEKMGYIALINAITKVITFVLILSVINTQEDKILLPVIYSASAIVLSIVGFITALKLGHITIVRPKINILKSYYNVGFDYFYSSIFVSIKDRSNIVILGYFFAGHYVIVYDLIMKIVSIISMPIGILNNVFYPQNVRDKSISKVKKIITYAISYSMFAYIISAGVVYFTDASLIELNDDDKLYFYIMLFIPVLLSVSQTISRNYLNAFGFRREYMQAITLVTILYFLTISLLIFLSKELYFLNYIIAIIVIYIFEFVIRAYYFFTLRYNH